MATLYKVVGFLLILNLICIVHSDHHQEPLKQVDKPLTLEEFQKFVQEGFPVIDLRHLPENGIIKGAYWVSENANIGQLTSFVLKPDSKFVVVTEEPKKIENFKKLVQAGFKNILGYNAFDMKQWKENLVKAQVKRFEQLDQSIKKAFIDVRSKPQILETGIFEGALWVPINQLTKRLDEVQEFVTKNKDSEIVVYCRMSPRARLAASAIMGKGLGPITVLNENIDRMRQKLVKFSEEL